MAISPTKPDGSAHINKFSGTLAVAGGATAGSGEFPNGTTFPTTALVKWGPLDMPLSTFDDYGQASDSAGVGPHTTVANRMWAQNSRVTVQANDQNTTLVALDATPWEIDATTGKPVLRTQITATATGGSVSVIVEIPFSASR